tara:strand:- start:19 stop:273 length:255 start_codon:yes stop_codon:yes gene_type:complete
VAFTPRISAPYIFFCFYARPDPKEYQTTGKVGNYVWGKKRLEHQGRYLVVYTSGEPQPENNARHEIRTTDGEVMMRVIEHCHSG